MKTEHADGHSGIDNLAHIFFFGWCWCWLSFRYTQSTCLPTEQREEEEGGQEQRGEYYFQNMIYGLFTIIGYQAPLLEFRTPPLCINSARTDVFRLIFNSTRSTSLSFRLRLGVLPNPCT
ncbi:hypothetical protein TWF217_000897 [Orbilia oligospora]|nr:hypothetical protein TWF217_000897 [Orbilia oligospora]